MGEGSGQAVLPISRDSSATLTKVLATFNFRRWVENLLTWSFSKSLFYLMYLKIHTSRHSLRRRQRQRETDRQADRQTETPAGKRGNVPSVKTRRDRTLLGCVGY